MNIRFSTRIAVAALVVAAVSVADASAQVGSRQLALTNSASVQFAQTKVAAGPFAQTQVASLPVVIGDASPGRTPRGALWRAAVFPGWGQAYNRQYAKLPFVYAALGGLSATIVILNDRYLLYRHAYQFKAYEEILEEGETNPRADFESDYLQLLERRGVGELSSAAIGPTRDALRRNRDLAIIGTGLVFGLSVLDAYVSAHLMDFDISDDLTVSVYPSGRGLRTTMLLRL